MGLACLFAHRDAVRLAASGAVALGLAGLCLPGMARAETLSVVAHIHTPVSGGEYTPDEIAGMLSAQRLDAGIITDHDHLEIEWGLPPFRNLLHYTYRRPSISTEGVDRYAASIRAAAARFPGLILIPGVESNPYYRVELDWSTFHLRVYNLHEHLLAIGLPPSDLVAVPSIANGFHASSKGRALAVAAAAGTFLVVIERLRRGSRRLRLLRTRRRRRPAVATILVLVFGLALYDALAGNAKRITQYGPDAGAAPYQLFIDWVTRRGGLTFWAHPGVNEVIRDGLIEVITRPYYEHLAETDAYTGLEDSGVAGGIWDQLLSQYCSGLRKHPPWLLAQADFKRGNPDRLSARVNYVEVSEHSEPAVIDALRAGRFYATQAALGREWRLDGFRVSDGARAAGSGETLEATAPLTVSARFTKLTPRAHGIWVQVIRQGQILLAQFLRDSGELSIPDSPPPTAAMVYYRLNAGIPARIELAANPIFVRGRVR